MFNPKVSPLFQKKLSWGMRILYSSGVWSYLCAAISTPTFIIIPLVKPHPPPPLPLSGNLLSILQKENVQQRSHPTPPCWCYCSAYLAR